ncbi:MAG TPA: zinc ribbon domain-containing protein [Candidatus Limnocylindrales bacterium]|nr:zinc ribbon domain-containing protein [Candidatus Limnocylindrales bacterium]
MGAKSAEIWVCANCRSVNNAGAKQCYNCRTPRDLAAVDPTQMEVTGHGQVRAVALPPFRSSRGRAVLASALILAVAALQVVSTVVSSAFIRGLLDGEPATDQQIKVLTNLSLTSLVFALLALVAWAIWLSRVVTEMPALGLGYPAATALTAFVENFIPLLNLFRVPAIVRDVVRRVDPHPGRGEALISGAWLGIFGGYLIPRIGGLLNAFGAASRDEALRKQLLVEGIATGVVFIGALSLVFLIWWIEVRIARRRRERPAAVVSDAGSPATIARQPVEPAVATVQAHSTPRPSTAGPHLIVTVDANGALTGEVDGESEPVTLESLRAAGEALYRANGSASIRITAPDDHLRAVARETFGVLSGAGVPTTVEP